MIYVLFAIIWVLAGIIVWGLASLAEAKSPALCGILWPGTVLMVLSLGAWDWFARVREVKK